MPISRKLKHSNVGLPSNLLHAVGHVAALWARIEYIIDSKMSEALALPGAPKVDPKMMVPFNQRLELLGQLCKQYLTDATDRGHAAQIIADLKLLVAYRNLVVHGAVGNSKQRRKRRVVYRFRRIAWDTPPRIVERRALTVADIEAFAAKLSDHVVYAGMIAVFFWSVERALRGKGAQ